MRELVGESGEGGLRALEHGGDLRRIIGDAVGADSFARQFLGR
jgi:hypothetical protein